MNRRFTLDLKTWIWALVLLFKLLSLPFFPAGKGFSNVSLQFLEWQCMWMCLLSFQELQKKCKAAGMKKVFTFTVPVTGSWIDILNCFLGIQKTFKPQTVGSGGHRDSCSTIPLYRWENWGQNWPGVKVSKRAEPGLDLSSLDLSPGFFSASVMPSLPCDWLSPRGRPVAQPSFPNRIYLSGQFKYCGHPAFIKCILF